MSLQEILKLPATERLDVIEQIWDSIKKEDLEFSDSQKKELDRRLELIKKNKIEWMSYDELKNKLKLSNLQ